MKILITGANGYIGAGIREGLKDNHDVIGTYHSSPLYPGMEKLDITDGDEVHRLVEKTEPDIIIHASAVANSTWCKENSADAMSINAEGTRSIVDAANDYKSKVVLISSIAALGNSVYGRSKHFAEQHAKATRAGYTILRPALTVGVSPNTKNDRPFNRFLRNITDGIPAVYDNETRFNPTWLRHIVEVIGEVIDKEIYEQTIPVTVPEFATRFTLARDILEPFGVDVEPGEPKPSSLMDSMDLTKLDQLDLPRYSYDDMIAGIREEIKDYLKSMES